MSNPPKHRHEMTLRIGGNNNEELARRLRSVADSIELHDIDGPREVTSSDGYWFTTEHSPWMTAEKYANDLRIWAEHRRAERAAWVQEADDALRTILGPTP